MGGLAASDGLVDERDPVGGEIVGPGPRRVRVDAISVLQANRVNLGFVAEMVDARRQDVVPVDEAGIDIGVEALAHVGGQGFEHVGGAGSSVGHVDKGELHAVAVAAVGDLAEARETRKALVLDHRRIFVPVP